MKRRTFITLIGGAAASPVVGRAQQPAKMKRVAMIHPATKAEDLRIGGDPNYTIILEEIKRLGYVEGVNLTVDRYSAEGRPDRFPEIAHEVVATRPDVIFAISDQVVLALSPKLPQFQSSAGLAIRSSLGSYRTSRDPVVTSLG